MKQYFDIIIQPEADKLVAIINRPKRIKVVEHQEIDTNTIPDSVILEEYYKRREDKNFRAMDGMYGDYLDGKSSDWSMEVPF
jgi:hypothetical protein